MHCGSKEAFCIRVVRCFVDFGVLRLESHIPPEVSTHVQSIQHRCGAPGWVQETGVKVSNHTY